MRTADERLAADLAVKAGDLLVGLRAEAGPEWDAAAGRELGRRGDLGSNELILTALAEARPDDAVLSEESADDPVRLGAERVWIIDPLDGTREYALPGRTDWAVHVGLWELETDGITAAAVSLPALGRVFGTETPEALKPFDRAGTVRTVVSESRPPSWLPALVEVFPLRMEIRPHGSAGAKAMAVLQGDADAYVHSGGQYEWDSAAPVGVVVAAGLHASRLDGSPLRYNREQPYLPDLVICRPEIAAELLDALAAVGATN